MNLIQKFVVITGAGLAISAESAVVTDSVHLADDGCGGVRISYSLDAPAVVTVDIQTNVSGQASGPWASIGEKNLRYMSGDVNRKIETTGAHLCRWAMTKAWPGHKVASGMRARVTAWPLDNPPKYMVVSLTLASNVWYYASAEELPYPVTDNCYRTSQLLMRKIPAAEVKWTKGRNGAVTDKGEYPPHKVTLSSNYYIGVFEMTVRQHEILTGLVKMPAAFKNDPNLPLLPAIGVSVGDIRGSYTTADYNWPTGKKVDPNSVVGKLSAFSGIAGFDLPTDAQWEFACRAGSPDLRYGNLADIAWISCESPHAVGGKAPNDFGLYDMLGNAYEYTLDWISPTMAEAAGADVRDPKGADAIDSRMSAYGNGGRTWRGSAYRTDFGDTFATASFPYTWNAEGTTWYNVEGYRLCVTLGTR